MDRFERARSLIANDDYKGALREYKAMKSKQPNDERALCGKALMHIIMNEPAEAAKCLSDAQMARPSAAYPHGIMGVIAEVDNPEYAINFYDSMIRADPSEAAAYVRKAQVLLDGGYEKECLDTINECAENADLTAEMPLAVERLRSFFKDARAGHTPTIKIHDSAVFIPGLRMLLDKAVGDELPLVTNSNWAAASLGTMDERSEVVEAIGRMRGSDPISSEALCMMGELLYGMGREDEAMACHERAIKENPGDMLGYMYKLVMLQDAGDRAGVSRCLGKALEAAPKDGRHASMQEKMRLWRDMLRDGKRSKFSVMGISSATRRHVARRYKSYVRAARPTITSAHRAADKDSETGPNYLLASIQEMIDEGRPKEAIRAYKSLLKLRKRLDENIARRRSRTARRAKRSAPAIPSLAQETGDRLARAARMLADDRFVEAMREYKAVVMQSPRDERALCGIALACVLSYELAEAAKCMNAALKMRPDAAYPHGILGAIAQETGDWKAALACYDSMILADPSEAAPYVRKAQMLLYGGREKECAEAISRCAEAARLDQDTPRAAERLRSIIEDVRAGRTPAIKISDFVAFVPGLRILLDKTVGNGLPTVDGLNVGAASLGASAERSDVIDALGHILKEQGSVEAWCAMGELLYLEGRIGESIECYDRAIELRPGNIDGYGQKLVVLQDAGDRADIMACLDEALEATPEHESAARMQDNLRSCRDALKDNRSKFSVVTIDGAVRRHMERRRSPENQAGSRLFPPGLVDEGEIALTETAARRRSPRRPAR